MYVCMYVYIHVCMCIYKRLQISKEHMNLFSGKYLRMKLADLKVLIHYSTYCIKDSFEFAGFI